jgi:hypothetical protein
MGYMESELVIDNPPLGTAPPQSETAQLTINTPISVECTNGAQVFTYSITPDGETAPQQFQAVAKTYGPLYCNFKEWIRYMPCEVVTKADTDYSRETSAYELLQERREQTGAFAPLYYVSWTIVLPIASRGKTQTRPVWLILIEYLSGTSIYGGLIRKSTEDGVKDAFHYPEEYRLEALAPAMDGYARQLHSGIE